MNISRLFILRPVATSLLMIALVLVGLVAVRFLPVSSLPDVDYPTIQVQTFYPGASPQVMATTVTAPLEVQLGEIPGPAADDLVQLATALGHHPAVRPVAEPRRRRAERPAGDQRRQQPAAEPACRRRRPTPRSIRPTSRSSPWPSRPSRCRSPSCRTSPTTGSASKIAEVPGVGLVTPVRRQRAGDPGRGGPAEARRLRPEHRRPAHAAQQHQRQPAEGQLRRSGARLHDQRQRPDLGSEGLSRHRRSPTRTARRSCCATSPR